MLIVRHIAGLTALILFLSALLLAPGSWQDRCFGILIAAGLLALLRLIIGPTTIDRAVALRTISVLIINIAIVLGVLTGRDLYIDIAIAWAFQAFIASLVLAKHAEGKHFDA